MTSQNPPQSTLPESSPPEASLPEHDGLVRVVDALREAVGRGEVTTVLVAVPDMAGRLKGKRFDARFFLERLVSGVEMCAYILATDTGMDPVDGFDLTGWESGYGDLRMRPDLHTLRRLPHEPGTVLVHGDPVHSDGAFVDVAPRQMLRAQLARLKALGVDVKTGLESEFLLYEDDPQQLLRNGFGGLRPLSPHNLDYALDHPPALTDFLRHLEEILRDAGTPAESVKTEGAPGQIEIAFRYGEAMAACDAYTVYRHATRVLAARRGLTATWMAAPHTGVGSGLHLHISLWEGKHSLFAPGSGQDQPDHLTRALSGLVDGMPDLMPLCAPYPNSYKRFAPHSFAPTRFGWGSDNRTAAFRITGHGTGRHVEVRLPGADANPYLALAAVCAATHHGLSTHPDLPDPCTGDGYEDTAARPVPRDLVDALMSFDSSTFAEHALGKHVVRHYARAAHHEIDHHLRHVTDIERLRGFDRV
ncbi:glutamine synthetase family protein [Streptomyces griseiscabiei]|uniref:Glutamine synthetase family protein n=1 Tax=Streptomyces griseiscabiei TaxID=2993540 RepID=A0ABU4LK14_9ACTN|nr:glutamine synthetase family protein [Streptomyces griseiscabiei]MBZ3906549.1 glutamine synthetase [Streptomyces griseiscabiei]MDX2916160.1 glutamine synthetase family protein [Streptomyces griseiscabiei]